MDRRSFLASATLMSGAAALGASSAQPAPAAPSAIAVGDRFTVAEYLTAFDPHPADVIPDEDMGTWMASIASRAAELEDAYGMELVERPSGERVFHRLALGWVVDLDWVGPVAGLGFLPRARGASAPQGV